MTFFEIAPILIAIKPIPNITLDLLLLSGEFIVVIIVIELIGFIIGIIGIIL